MTDAALAPRRLTSTPQSVEPATTVASGSSRSSRSASASVSGRANERPLVAQLGRRGLGGRRAQPYGERVVRRWGAEGIGRVADRAVAGAAAEVPAQRVQVEPVGTVLVVGLGIALARGAAIGPVVLGGHAADESRRAVPALRAPADRHLLLHGVQLALCAQPFGGDDLLAVERGDGHQAGVDGHPFRRRAEAGTRHQHRAGPALSFGAALLAPGETALAKEVQRRGVEWHAGDRRPLTIDRDLADDHVTRSCALEPVVGWSPPSASSWNDCTSAAGRCEAVQKGYSAS